MRKRLFWKSIFFISLFFINSVFCLAGDSSEDCYVIYGDTRSGHTIHQKIVDEIMKIKPKAVFHTGDVVDRGENASEWLVFDKITAGLRGKIPFYPVMGNHEKNAKIFFEDFAYLPNNKRWYTVETDKIHFVALDSTYSLQPGSEQYKWLEEDLKAGVAKKKFIIVVMHHPILSVGVHYKAANFLRPMLGPLFEKYGVSMVFSGHDHNYQRFFYNHIFYIVTGGGGAELYGQEKNDPLNQIFKKVHNFCRLCVGKGKLHLKVYDLDLNLIDEMERGL